MAVAYFASTSLAAGNGTSIAAHAKSAGIKIGNVLVAEMYIEKGAGVGAYTIASTGDTWTLVNIATNTGATPNFDLVTWQCVVGNTTSTISVTWDGSNVWRDFSVHTFTGVDTTTPEDCASTNNSGSGVSETGLAVTTVTNGAHIVLLTANFDGNARSGQTSPLSERHDGGNVHMAAGMQDVAGSSGNKTATISTSQWAAVLMALRPARSIINAVGHETGDFIEALSSAGTVSIDASIKRTGNYSYRFNPTAGTGNVTYNAILATGKVAEILRTAETFVSFYLYFTALPSGGTMGTVRFRNSVGTEIVRINVGTTGIITLVGVGTSATVATISTGIWYRFDMRVTSNGVCGLSVDGGTEVTETGNNAQFDRIIVGCTSSNTCDGYMDDLVISDVAKIQSPEVRLSIHTANHSVISNATHWGSSGRDYTELDEVPHNGGTDYIEGSSITNDQYILYPIQSRATIGSTGTIVAVKPMVIMSESASTTTSGGLQIRSGSTDSTSTLVDMGNTAYILITKILDLDPNGEIAWTTSAFDALISGPRQSGDASALRCTASYVGSVTEHIPSAPTVSIPPIQQRRMIRIPAKRMF